MMMLLLQAATGVAAGAAASLPGEPAMSVTTELPALLATSAFSVSIIQAIKNSQLPIFKAFGPESVGLNRTLAWVAAFIAGVGIHWHYDPALGSLTITGLTMAALTSATINTMKSYGFNWFVYNVSGVKQRSSDVAAVAGGARVTPVAGPGTVKAGVDQANEGGVKP